MVSIKRVAYGYNSILEAEGKEAWFLDALVQEDSEVLVDVHQSFKSQKAFMQVMSEIIPVLEGEVD